MASITLKKAASYWLLVLGGVFCASRQGENSAIILPSLHDHPFVGKRDFRLTDTRRLNQYAPDFGPKNATRYQEVMVSLFYPTGQMPSQSSSTSAYMPQLTADIWNEDLAGRRFRGLNFPFE